MTYSVWNYRARRYDYYRAGGPGPTHAGTPPTALVSSPLGQTPDQAAWKLPAGSVKIGAGEAAQGRIASLGDDTVIGGMLPWLAALGVAAYIFTRHR